MARQYLATGDAVQGTWVYVAVHGEQVRWVYCDAGTTTGWLIGGAQVAAAFAGCRYHHGLCAGLEQLLLEAAARHGCVRVVSNSPQASALVSLFISEHSWH
jgi:hypothetical protein